MGVSFANACILGAMISGQGFTILGQGSMIMGQDSLNRVSAMIMEQGTTIMGQGAMISGQSANYLGQTVLLFLARFALDNSKSRKWSLCPVMIGSSVDKTQQSLSFVSRFAIRFQKTGQFQPNIIRQKWTCPFYFGLVHGNSPQINEKTPQFSGENVNEKRNVSR